MRYHLTPVRMTIINKITKNNCWHGCREKGTLVQCQLECRLVQPLWKTVWNFLRKLKMGLHFDPAITLLTIYPNNPKSSIQMNLCTPMFIAALFIIAKCLKQLKCPLVNECFKKLWYIYTMEFYTIERKTKGTLTFCNSRDGARDYTK